MNHSLEKRIEILEKNLRFYRVCFIGLLIAATGGVMMSFNQKNTVPDLIQARAFEVVDEYGKSLIQLNKENGNGHIETYSSNGKSLVSLFTSDGGAGGINTFDKNGQVLFKVTNTLEGGGYMAIFNGGKKEIAEIGVTNSESGYLRINDRIGNKIAWITYTQDGGGYFSLSKDAKEYFRFSTPDVGGRMGIYNKSNTRIAYIGTQDTKDGNITIWNNSGTRLGGIPQ